MRLALAFIGFSASLGAGSTLPDLSLYPRGAALGGACGACRGTAEALWYNPAGLRGPGHDLGAVSMQWIEGLRLMGLQARSGGAGGGFALGLQGFSLQDQSRDELGRPGAAFEYSEQVLALGASSGGERLALGLGARARFIQEPLPNAGRDSSMRTAHFDAGLQGALPWRGWRWGADWRGLELNGSMPQNCWIFCLPNLSAIAPDSRLSLQWQPPSLGLTVLGDLRYDASLAGYSWRAGLEQAYGRREDLAWAMRLGWSSDLSSLGDLAGFSAGLGLSWDWASFDYALSQLGDFGQAHRAALSLRFDAINASTR